MMKFGCFWSGMNIFTIEENDKKTYYCTAQDFCDKAKISKKFYFKDLKIIHNIVTINHDALTEYLKKQKYINHSSAYYGKFFYVNLSEITKSIGKFNIESITDIISEKNKTNPLVFNDDAEDDIFDDDEEEDNYKPATTTATRQIKQPVKKLGLKIVELPRKPAELTLPHSVVQTESSSKSFELNTNRDDIKKTLLDMERRLQYIIKAQMTGLALDRLMNDTGIRQAAIQKMGEQVSDALRRELTPIVREKIRTEIASSVRAELTQQFTPLVKEQLKRQLEPEVAQEVIAKSAAPIPDLGNEVSNYISKFNKHK